MTFNKVSALFDEKFVACDTGGNSGGSSGGSSTPTCNCVGTARTYATDIKDDPDLRA